MNSALPALLEKLRGRMESLIQASPHGAYSTPEEEGFACLSEALHAISMAGLAMLRQKNNHIGALGEAAETVLQDPGVENHVRFQSLLFSSYRDIYGQIFPVHIVGKDLLPLYLRKYQQVLEELAQMGRVPPQSRRGAEFGQCVADAATFLVNNWSGSIAVLRPSPGAAEGPIAETVAGPPPAAVRLKGLPAHIQAGIYLLGGASSAISLHPFYYLGPDGPCMLRMLTSDGAFYRRLGREGYHLLFGADLLMDLGEFFFRIGSYGKALNLYRLVEHENRGALVMVSALHHCLNAQEFSRQGDSLKAIGEWELCIQVKQDLPVLYHELSRDCLGAGRHAQAAAAINRLLERFPTSDEGFVALGDIYTARGDHGRAQRAYDKACLLNPNHPQAQQKRLDSQKKLESKSPQEPEKAEALSGEMFYSLGHQLLRKPRVRLLGRDEALLQLLEVLTCRDKKNALLVGDAGVGKTAIVEEAARRFQEPSVPEALQGKGVTALNLGALIAGARYRGQFEERILEALKRLRERSDIALVENIHLLVSTGSTRGGSLDAASLLKPALTKGEIQVIGTTDEESLGNILEKDPSFLKLFHVIRIEELPKEVVREVISERKGEYEGFHGVVLPEGLVENSLDLIRLSIPGRALPESALDLMDRACARVALASPGRRERLVAREDLLHTLSEMSGISYERLALLERERLDTLEDYLAAKIVDQPEAISAVSRVVRAAKLGLDLDPRRPDGVFLFVGPTGVGKTALARSLAGILFGDEEKLVRIDMSEYMDRISTSRLIGTAPGYVGYYDQNQLTDQVRKNPYCVILFDEVEKADPQVLNLFLQIFDAGRLTDGKGRTVRFNHATVIMTSNLGAQIFCKARMGYRDDGASRVEEEAVLKEVRSFFSPEFLNRIDEVVVFKNLSEESMSRIAELELANLTARLSNEGKTLRVLPEARRLLAREGYSFEFGARNLKRVVRRLLAEPLAKLALSREWERAAGVEVSEQAGEIRLRLILSAYEVSVEEHAEDLLRGATAGRDNSEKPR